MINDVNLLKMCFYEKITPSKNLFHTCELVFKEAKMSVDFSVFRDLYDWYNYLRRRPLYILGHCLKAQNMKTIPS